MVERAQVVPVDYIDAFRYKLPETEVEQLAALRGNPDFRKGVRRVENEISKALNLKVHFLLATCEFHIVRKSGREVKTGLIFGEDGSIEWSCEALHPAEYNASYYFFCQLRSMLAAERKDPRFTSQYLLAHGTDLRWPATEEEAEGLLGLRKRVLASPHKRELVQTILDGIVSGQKFSVSINWESWEVDFGNTSEVQLKVKDRVWVGSNLNDTERLLSVVIICTLFTLSHKL